MTTRVYIIAIILKYYVHYIQIIYHDLFGLIYFFYFMFETLGIEA